MPWQAAIASDPRYVGLYERFDGLVGAKALWDYNATEDNTEVEVTNTLTKHWELLGTGTETCTRATTGGVILTTTNSSADSAFIVPNSATVVTSNFASLVWDFDLQNVWWASIVTGASVADVSYFFGLKTDDDFGVDDADLFGISFVSGTSTSFALAARRNSTDLFDSNSYGSAQTRVYNTGIVPAASTAYMVGGWVDRDGYPTWFIGDQVFKTSIDDPGILSASAGSTTGGLRGGTSSVTPFLGVQTNTTAAKTCRLRNVGFFQLYE